MSARPQIATRSAAYLHTLNVSKTERILCYTHPSTGALLAISQRQKPVGRNRAPTWCITGARLIDPKET
jgi:hypothetical protein